MADKLIQTRVPEELNRTIEVYCAENLITKAQFLREAAQNEVERPAEIRRGPRRKRATTARYNRLHRRVKRIEEHLGLKDELDKALDEMN